MCGLDFARLYPPATLALLAVLVGCAEGPMPYIMSLNPKTRQEWAADEMYEPTLHRQLAEVKALRESAATLSAAKQRHWSGELQYILQHHDNPLLRASAVKTLAEFAVPEANEGLRVALTDGDATVQQTACAAWGARGGEEALQRLAEVLDTEKELDVRIAAARELRRFQDPTAYRALGVALQDPDPALQYQAVESLREASGKEYGNDLQAWRKFARGQDPGPEHSPSVAQRLRKLL
ncbi:MAG: HEAT repeat domain-containing protein [Planctomycetota bacterium]